MDESSKWRLNKKWQTQKNKYYGFIYLKVKNKHNEVTVTEVRSVTFPEGETVTGKGWEEGSKALAVISFWICIVASQLLTLIFHTAMHLLYFSDVCQLKIKFK